MTKYVAHISSDHRAQSVKDHLVEVRDLSEGFGAKLGMAHVAGLIGWLHDAGKYSQAFQTYIQQSAEGAGQVQRGQVNHAFAGARLLRSYLPETEDGQRFGDMVGNIIMAHHSPAGPYDYYSPLSGEAVFNDKLAKPITDWKVADIADRFFKDFGEQDFKRYVAAALDELRLASNPEQLQWQFFSQRFLASCLIDADHLLTADFMDDQHPERHPFLSMTELAHRFEAHNQEMVQNGKQTANAATQQLNELRTKMSTRALHAAAMDSRLFSLSVPTGGGKTFASLRFGLAEGVKRALDRVIYVVPFTTVIEQNAEQIRKMLGIHDDDPDLIEYHSAINADETTSPAVYYARDTWDAPVVMTTQVAYLNAMFGKGSKNLRHMHRLVNSTVIFDEIQSMPVKSVGLNTTAINWLTQHGSSTVMLCTATQPALKQEVVPSGLTEQPVEVVENIELAEQAFKRVRLHVEIDEPWDIDQLTQACEQSLNQVDSVLVVLNTKKAVREVYRAFRCEGVDKYHLSTSMCAAHREETFLKIKNGLTASASEHKVIVFSTKLIEAGVDLSFEMVYRSLAGIDSVVQAAGRCNRNHERKLGDVYLIKMSREIERMPSALQMLSEGALITETLINSKPDVDPMSAEFVQEYFARFYQREREQLSYPLPEKGSPSLVPMISAPKGQLVNPQGLLSYQDRYGANLKSRLTTAGQTVADKYRVIDSNTYPVLIQWREHPENAKIVAALSSESYQPNELGRLLKQAQPYIVQVYGDPRHSGLSNVLAAYHSDSGIWIADETAYSDEYGLDDSGGGTLPVLQF